jgi:hypothetical protein
VKAGNSGLASRLSIDMMISEEPWMEGGPATYALDLKRDGDRISGTWRGKFRLNEGGGAVEGTVVGLAPPPSPATSMRAWRTCRRGCAKRWC